MFRVSRLGELMKLVPRGTFDRAVREHGADKYRKRNSCWHQLTAMVCAQLAGATSLRVLATTFNAQSAHHYHLGCRPVHRSTLAQMNASTPIEVFEALVQALMQQCARKQRREAKELLKLLDSSSITLKGHGFDEWTGENRTRNTQGVKLHVLFGLPEEAPLACSISAPNVNDIEYAHTLPIQPGSTYVFDKAYCNFNWWLRIEQSGAHFVTRFKRNTRLALVRTRPIAQKAQGVILADEIVRFANARPGGGRKNPYQLPLRRITVARENNNAPLVLATNDMKSSALKIAQHYRSRWQIELFFKWIKQHLRIKRFMGRTQRAVQVQILTALIAYLLVALYAKIHQLKQSLWMVLSEVRATLFQRADVELTRHRRWRERRSLFESLQGALFE